MEKKHTLDAYDNYFILGDGGKRVIKIDAYKSFILGNGERNDILKETCIVWVYILWKEKIRYDDFTGCMFSILFPHGLAFFIS